MEPIGVQNDLGAVVKEDTRGLVGEVVAETVLGGVVNPLLDPDFTLGSDSASLGCREVIGPLKLLGGEPVHGSSNLVLFAGTYLVQ